MIIVVGAGEVGTALDAFGDVRLYPSSVWDGYSEKRRAVVFKDADIFVNAVAINGASKCADAGYDAVMRVNVAKALGYGEQGLAAKVPTVQLSTMGMYLWQSCPAAMVADAGRIPKEGCQSRTFPHNLYVASKILMEQATLGICHILRLPWFVPTLEQRAVAWTEVQDTYTSIITPERLRECLWKLVDAPRFLYQCHSGINYLPDMFPELAVRTEVPVGMTSAIPLHQSAIFRRCR